MRPNANIQKNKPLGISIIYSTALSTCSIAYICRYLNKYNMVLRTTCQFLGGVFVWFTHPLFYYYEHFVKYCFIAPKDLEKKTVIFSQYFEIYNSY